MISPAQFTLREPWMMPPQAQAMNPTKVKKSFVFEGRRAP
jgi:hypothetical protein